MLLSIHAYCPLCSYLDYRQHIQNADISQIDFPSLTLQNALTIYNPIILYFQSECASQKEKQILNKLTQLYTDQSFISQIQPYLTIFGWDYFVKTLQFLQQKQMQNAEQHFQLFLQIQSTTKFPNSQPIPLQKTQSFFNEYYTQLLTQFNQFSLNFSDQDEIQLFSLNVYDQLFQALEQIQTQLDGVEYMEIQKKDHFYQTQIKLSILKQNNASHSVFTLFYERYFSTQSSVNFITFTLLTQCCGSALLSLVQIWIPFLQKLDKMQFQDCISFIFRHYQINLLTFDNLKILVNIAKALKSIQLYSMSLMMFIYAKNQINNTQIENLTIFLPIIHNNLAKLYLYSNNPVQSLNNYQQSHSILSKFDTEVVSRSYNQIFINKLLMKIYTLQIYLQQTNNKEEIIQNLIKQDLNYPDQAFVKWISNNMQLIKKQKYSLLKIILKCGILTQQSDLQPSKEQLIQTGAQEVFPIQMIYGKGVKKSTTKLIIEKFTQSQIQLTQKFKRKNQNFTFQAIRIVLLFQQIEMQTYVNSTNFAEIQNIFEWHCQFMDCSLYPIFSNILAKYQKKNKTKFPEELLLCLLNVYFSEYHLAEQHLEKCNQMITQYTRGKKNDLLIFQQKLEKIKNLILFQNKSIKLNTDITKIHVKQDYIQIGKMVYNEIIKFEQLWKQYFQSLDNDQKKFLLQLILFQGDQRIRQYQDETEFKRLFTLAKLLKHQSCYHLAYNFYYFLKNQDSHINECYLPFIYYQLAKIALFLEQLQLGFAYYKMALDLINSCQRKTKLYSLYEIEYFTQKIQLRIVILSFYLEIRVQMFVSLNYQLINLFENINKWELQAYNHKLMDFFAISYAYCKIRKIQFLYPSYEMMKLADINESDFGMLQTYREQVNLDSPLLHLLLRTNAIKKNSDKFRQTPTFIIDYCQEKGTNSFCNLLLLNLILKGQNQSKIITRMEMENAILVLEDYLQMMPNQIISLINIIFDVQDKQIYRNLDRYLIAYMMYYISEYELSLKHLHEFKTQFLLLKIQDSTFNSKLTFQEIKVHILNAQNYFGLQNYAKSQHYFDRAINLFQQVKVEVPPQLKYWCAITYKLLGKLEKCTFYCKSLGEDENFRSPSHIIILQSANQMSAPLQESHYVQEVMRQSLDVSQFDSDIQELRFSYAQSIAIKQSYEESQLQSLFFNQTNKRNDFIQFGSHLQCLNEQLFFRWEQIKEKQDLFEQVETYEFLSKKQTIRPLSANQNSNVFLIEFRNTNYAVKQIDICFKEFTHTDNDRFLDVFDEIDILIRLLEKANCKAFLQLKYLQFLFVKKTDFLIFQFYLVFPFYKEDIASVQTRSLEDKQKFCKSLLEQLEKIHQCDIIHLDLKPNNILFQDEQIFIIDFGSALYNSSKKKFYQITERYCAPEIYSGNITYKADVYSFGCIVYELFTKLKPQLSTDRFNWLHLKNTVPPNIYQLVQMATAPLELRASIQELIQLI